jgi:acyl carrier protein
VGPGFDLRAAQFHLFRKSLYYKYLREKSLYRGFENMEDLKNQIKEMIISALELEDIKPENINDSEAIFGEGLGLDSIDALELGVALKKKFGVKFSSENADNKKHFASVDALAAYITAETAGR